MSIAVPHKKRGRPATGESPKIGVRFSSLQMSLIEAFAEHEGLGRSEAIRQLVEVGLAALAVDDDPEYNRLTRIDLWRMEDERMASRVNAVRLLLDYGIANLPPARSDDPYEVP
jgi:hypothetical protein